MTIKLPPIGFWSYARQNDEASYSQLSGLRVLVMSELQQQYGRDRVNIFQDIAAIPPGAEWKREITNSLNKSTFLIPIITPAFIESEMCADEVRIFLERERSLNADHPQLAGRRRIFPLQYLPIDDVEPYDKEVLDELKRLQWFDFRTLRFKPQQDEVVGKAIADYATGMCRLLQIRVDPPLTAEQRAAAEAAQAKAEADRLADEARREADRRAQAEAERSAREEADQARRKAAEKAAHEAAETLRQKNEAKEARRAAARASGSSAGFMLWFRSQEGWVQALLVLAPALFLVFALANLSRTPATASADNTTVTEMGNETTDTIADNMTAVDAATMDNSTASNEAVNASLTADETELRKSLTAAEQAESSGYAAAAKGEEAATLGDAARKKAVANIAGYSELNGTSRALRTGEESGKYTYYGHVSNADEDGYGVMIFSDGAINRGLFKNGHLELGVSKYSNRESYSGYFKDDNKSGFGVYIFPEGYKYTGTFLNDRFDGYAIFYLNSSTYKGHFKNDVVDGYGAWYDGNKYKESGLYKSATLTRHVDLK